MSLVDILANPDLAQNITYLAQQAPAPSDGGGGGGGQGAEGFYGVLRQIGEFVRNAGLLVLAICVVAVGVVVGTKAVSSKEGGGIREALSSLSGLLIAGLIIGGGATLVGFAMQFGGELG